MKKKMCKIMTIGLLGCGISVLAQTNRIKENGGSTRKFVGS